MITELINTEAAVNNGVVEQSPLNAITNFCENIANKARGTSGQKMELTTADALAIIEVILLGMSDAAKTRKTTEGPIAIVIDSLKGEPILSLKVAPTEATEEEPDGAWEPSYVFGSEQLEGVTQYKVSDTKLHECFIREAASVGFSFANPTFIYTAILCFAEMIFTYLDAAAVEGEDVELTHPGFFTASAKVVDGRKIFSFSAEEEVTNKIKEKNC